MKKFERLDEISSKIGDRLKEFAGNFGGVSRLADTLDISQSHLSGTYISGKSIPGGLLLLKLALIGCDINWLLTGSGSGSAILKTGDINGDGNSVTVHSSSHEYDIKILDMREQFVDLKTKLADYREIIADQKEEILKLRGLVNNDERENFNRGHKRKS